MGRGKETTWQSRERKNKYGEWKYEGGEGRNGSNMKAKGQKPCRHRKITRTKTLHQKEALARATSWASHTWCLPKESWLCTKWPKGYPALSWWALCSTLWCNRGGNPGAVRLKWALCCRHARKLRQTGSCLREPTNSYRTLIRYIRYMEFVNSKILRIIEPLQERIYG